MVAGLVMMVGGAAMVWIAWLGSQHRLPRNGWAGIRIPSTMRSDQAWEAAHSAAAGPLGIAGGIFVCGGLAVATSGIDNAVGHVALLVALIGGVAALAAATVAARRAARAVD